MNKLYIIVFLFLLPIINAVMIGNQAITFSSYSNSTIRFEQNTSLDLLRIDENTTEIYNISTDNIVFKNINQTYNANLNFYGNISNTMVYSSDGVAACPNFSNCNYNINATFSPNSSLYLLKNFNVTENVARINSPINLQRISYNDIEVDSIIKSSNILVYIHHRCSEITSIDYYKFGASPIDQSFTCSNDVISLTISEILIASSNQYIKLRTSLVSSGGSGGGSRQVLPEDLVYLINISSKNDFKFDIRNSIIVEVFNKSNKLIDVDKVNISVIDDIKHTSFNITRRSQGTYKKDFIINKDKIEEFEIKVKIFDKGSLITQTKTFIITNPILLDVIVDKSKSNLSRLAELIEDNWLLVLSSIIVIIGLIIIIIIIIAIRKKKKKKEKKE